MVKIITMCHQGLCRSVALADVLKLHFRPVDVIPIGHFGNTKETQKMLFNWADYIIAMEIHYFKYIPEEYKHKRWVCDVGPDTYHSSKNPFLIEQCWNWCRKFANNLGIEEHFERL